MNEHDSTCSTRRDFLMAGGAVVAASAVPGTANAHPHEEAERAMVETQEAAGQTDGEITRQTIAEAEKLAGVEYTDDEREMILRGIGRTVQGFVQRRSFAAPNGLAPATVFDPRLPGVEYEIAPQMVRSQRDPGPLPVDVEDIAFAPVTRLSRWIESGRLSSEALTRLYLKRLKEIGPKLECVITFTEERAIEQAKRADREIAAGRYRGPLHGVPWGAKDLLDTKGIRTSWGATPYKDRVPDRDAAVVKMLDDAGAVLIAKLTLGALAYGDIWFDGRTNNPWNLEQGSSGSSAGSAAATAAGLVGFAIGTETLGSIVSPSMRCGTTGLRPTFGRVPRTGAMALCWSLDKIGVLCRTVEDAILVLDAINGPDSGDPSSLDVGLRFDARNSPVGMRVGYDPAWFEGRGANDIDRRALDAAREVGVQMVEIELPELPYGILRTILNAEAAAAFEELTLTNRDDELRWQVPRAWPNTFRQARFIPAIEVIQANRLRRHVMQVMHDLFEEDRLETLIGPSFAGGLLLITNNTGHPSLTIRAGFREGRGHRVPHGVTLWGRLFDEGRLCNLGMALEAKLDVWHERPPLT